jgi:colicin import membrane protein
VRGCIIDNKRVTVVIVTKDNKRITGGRMKNSKEHLDTRRAPLSYLEVQAAADAIIAEGLSPTVRTVYEKVGEFGSFATIGKMLNRWKAERPAKEAQEGERISQESADNLARDIQRAIDRRTADLRSDLLSVKKDYEELLDQAGELEEEHEKLKIQAADLSAKNSTLIDELGNAKSQADDAKEELKELRSLVENQRMELATARASQEMQKQKQAELENIISQKRDETEQALLRATSAERGEAVANAKKDAADVTIEKQEKHIEQHLLYTEQLQGRIDALQARVDLVTKEAASEAKDHAITLSKLNEQLHVEHKKNAELCSEIDHLKDTVTALKQAAKNKGAK